jgi:hypothetical protein
VEGAVTQRIAQPTSLNEGRAFLLAQMDSGSKRRRSNGRRSRIASR